MKAHAGIFESDPPEEAARKFDRAVPESAADAPWIRQRLRPLVGLETEATAEREESFAAWRGFLELIAEAGPAVFIVEDLHWADEPMLVFLEDLADRSAGLPMLLVGTARPELFERHPGWGGGLRNAITVHLEPLSDVETAQLVASLLERAVLPAEMQQAILERAGGNPLYAEEFVRSLRDRGLVDDRGHLTADPGELAFPDSVQGLIAGRLDTLAPERKALLQDAAVLGKVFWIGAVVEMSGRAEPEVAEALHDLSRKELVRRARTSSVEGEREFSFWHAIVRDVAYGQLPRRARAERHRAAADWIERAAGGRAGDVSDALAYHRLQAFELFDAAGMSTEAEDARAPAVAALYSAAMRTLNLEGPSAHAVFSRALELAPSTDVLVPDILFGRAQAARAMGKLAEATVDLEACIAAFEARGNELRLIEAEQSLSSVLRATGDARWRAVSDRAGRLIESSQPDASLLAVMSEQAFSFVLEGREEDGLTLVDRAFSLASASSTSPPPTLFMARGLARLGTGDSAGVDDLRLAATAAVEQGEAFRLSALYGNLAAAVCRVEGAEEMLSVCREGAAYCDAHGYDRPATILRAVSLEALYDLGAWEVGLETATRCRSSLEEDRYNLAWIASQEALIHLGRGDVQAAAPAVSETTEFLRSFGERDFEVVTLTLCAMLEHARGRGAMGVSLLERLLEDPDVRQNDDYVDVLPQLVIIAVANGALTLARTLADIDDQLPRGQVALMSARATIDEAEERHEQAGLGFEEAAARWASLDNAVERTSCLIGLGRCRVRLGYSSTANQPLQQALEEARRIGARPMADECERWLRRSQPAIS